jgi:hypothetical protein
MWMPACGARQAGSLVQKVAQEAKEVTIGGKNWSNLTPGQQR